METNDEKMTGETVELEAGGQDLTSRKTIFINCVDLYAGKNIGKYLSSCVVGATSEEQEEEEHEEDDDSEEESSVLKAGRYEVIGTLADKSQIKPDFVKEIIQFKNTAELLDRILQCDIIVYDITDLESQIQEAVTIATEIHNNIDKIDKKNPKTFILISTVLTWAKTKVNEEDADIPFMEEDYRKRKAHPDFIKHIEAEREITKLGKTNKSKFNTYVVAAGLTYGAEENIFHYLFKSGWHNAEELLCYGRGSNVVPTIHIKDLAAVIQNIADSRPKVRYILAVDESINTLHNITKAVSDALCSGKVKKIPVSDALLIKDLKQRDLTCLTVDVKMTSGFIKESMKIDWVSEEGLVENINKIIEEFKGARNLLPVRLMVVGPPSCGKTTVVRQLCDHFKLHHVNVKDVIEESISKRTLYLAEVKEREARREEREAREGEESGEEEEEEEEEEDEEDGGRLQEYEEMLEEIRESREENNGRLDESLLVKLYREKLLSKSCQNQGFIIDGLPRTSRTPQELATDLFAKEEDEEEGEEEEQEEEGRSRDYSTKLMPELIISLEAPDSFIRARVIELPEAAVMGTHNTEQGLERRLTEYRQVNTEDENVINYFHEREANVHRIDITSDDSLRMRDTVERIIRLVSGGPRNYGPTEQEKAEARRKEKEEQIKRETEEKREREASERESKLVRERQQQEWKGKLDSVMREEEAELSTRSEPLRNYLMRFVLPTLTQGLAECCKVRPEDPIDYLAEYLFKHNPQVD